MDEPLNVVFQFPWILVKTPDNKEIRISSVTIIGDEVKFYDKRTYTWVHLGTLDLRLVKNEEEILAKVTNFIKSIIKGD